MLQPYDDRHSQDNGRHDQHKHQRPPLDPLITLQTALDHNTGAETPMGSAASRSSIASVCFVPSLVGNMNGNDNDEPDENDNDDSSDDSDSDSDDDELPVFQCQSLLQSESLSAHDPTREARQRMAATSNLKGRFLASCHANGECLLWDLHRRQIVEDQFIPPRGPGWSLRRLYDNQRFLYQTRDPRGTVSLHHWDHSTALNTTATTLSSILTFSQTFCAAAPCHSNAHLVALPSAEDFVATIRDWRMKPTGKPVAVFHGAGTADNSDNDNDTESGPFSAGRRHGMLTSLAFSESNIVGGGDRPIVACGMESGTVFFHDLRMVENMVQQVVQGQPMTMPTPGSIQLSTDPVLALDMAPSHHGNNNDHAAPGVVAIAGMAGENLAQKELPQDEQGTVAIIKATFPDSDDNNVNDMGSINVRVRSRLPTCQITGEGKPGVNLCRFQPGEGRLFAVAGWDQRVRIMDRAASAQKSPLRAILKGHLDSCSAMDWAPDSQDSSGLCATGAADGKIHIWRCFSKPTTTNTSL